jgi:hypothetical protein
MITTTTAPPLQKTSVDCHGYVVNDKNEMDLNHNYDNLTEKVDNKWKEFGIILLYLNRSRSLTM